MALHRQQGQFVQWAISQSTRAKPVRVSSNSEELGLMVCQECARVIALSFPSGAPLDGFGLPIASAMRTGLYLKPRLLHACGECEAGGFGTKQESSFKARG